jgi:protein-tyrosine-phosphatase
MNGKASIVFVCEHGAAKSVVAAAHFNRIASEMNLNIHAVARGTMTEAKLSPAAVEGLRRDGLMPGESVPRKLSPADVNTTLRLVSFCELPEEHQTKIILDRWDDVPSVSEEYDRTRNATLEKLKQLMEGLSWLQMLKSEVSRREPSGSLRSTFGYGLNTMNDAPYWKAWRT